MADWIEDELSRSYERATKKGEAQLAMQPQAASAHYDFRRARLVVELTNGVILMFPPKLLQGLKNATRTQLAEVELTPLGTGLHWEALDADLGVADLAASVFGSKAWMSELARFAGSRTSERKANSSRENGKRGGRPRFVEKNAQGKKQMPATWGGRSHFKYQGSVAIGTRIFYGKGREIEVSADKYAALRNHFRGRKICVGTSRTNPSANSLGHWLRKNVTATAIASYVAPILIQEGYANRIDTRDIEITK